MKFKGDIRELLIGSWKTIERAGGKPTINAVIRAARECYGATFRTMEGFSILKPFAEKAQSGTTFPARGNNIDANTKQYGTTREQNGNKTGTTFPARGNNSGTTTEQHGNSNVRALRPSPIPYPKYPNARTRESKQAQGRTPEEEEAVRRAIERAAEQTRRSEEL
jgi:hypothetical protein